MGNSTAVGMIALVIGVTVSARADNNSPFETLRLQGDATLTSGSITNDAAKSLGAGSIGIFAETSEYLSFTASFSFGSEGTTLNIKGVSDYVDFVRSPASSVGGQVQVRQLWKTSWLKDFLRAGITMNAKAAAATLTTDNMTASQRVSVIVLEPAGVASILFDKERRISLIVEAGLTSRLWNKPKGVFRDAIGLDTDEHNFWGVRGTGALQIGDVYVGIELLRLWGGDLDALKEFAIIPYVGVRGGIDLGKSKTAPGQLATPQLPAIF